MKSSHWVIAGFVALTLGCSGAAVADHEKGHHEGGGKWRHGGPGCGMSEEKRELLHSAMKKAHGDNEALKKRVQDRHAALQKVLGAKKFDQQAFLSVYDELAALGTQKKRNMASAFADVAGKLSPDERKKCAMFLAGGRHHGGKMGRHGGGHGGPWMHHSGRGEPRKFEHRMEDESAAETAKPAGDWDKLNK